MSNTPNIGDLVKYRNRFYLVNKVEGSNVTIGGNAKASNKQLGATRFIADGGHWSVK